MSTYLPDGFCCCLPEAPSAVVRLVNERAAVPYGDVSLATHAAGHSTPARFGTHPRRDT
jgi:hypothetical protein